MLAVGYTRIWLTPWPTVPLAGLAYVACLRALGGLTDERLRSLRHVVPRKLLDRFARQASTEA